MIVPADMDGSVVVAEEGSDRVIAVERKRLDWTEATGQEVVVYTIPGQSAGTCVRLSVYEVGTTEPICWREDPYESVLPAAVKSYTYQRASVPVDDSWGGPYARPAGHPDTAVRFHRSTDRDTTITYASPSGWYDAGDYGKYVVNAGFSVGMMLQLLEQYPGVLADGTVGFSESGNGTNDLLDELRVELDWMLTMQDPADGGVHHKLTTLDFQGMDMPHEMDAQRYIMAKSTTATLDFAASLALASRVWRRAGDAAYAKTLLDAAERAYDWAQLNPDDKFENPEDVRTGEYGDGSAQEERVWTRTELWLTTGKPVYAPDLASMARELDFNAGENWTVQMRNLAAYSLLTADRDRGKSYATLSERVVTLADSLIDVASGSAYFQPINEWHWGSTSDVLGAAMLVAQAYRLTGENKYLQAVRDWTTWVFGANATGYCFVTGFGRKSPMHIHHRPSEADGVEAPVPGFIAGGPNTYQQDTSNNAQYPYPPGVHPQTSYTDQVGSYASNEVCLNWNAPLVYVLGFLAAEGDR